MLLAPLPFAIPLLVAAVLAATSRFTSRAVIDLVAIGTAIAVTAICAILLANSAQAPLVYAFGGWRPQGSVVLGVLFVIDPLGAGLATLVSALVTASLIFSWRYFEEVKSLFHILMLVFLGSMAGFCLTGDLFNLFVCFELMGVAAFALTGYKVEETGPIQGALNFAVTNSIAAYLILTGIGLLYGRTGALNFAQIGLALAGHPPDGLVIVSFVLITAGFLVKAAVVPFHFWLADAHAVAPTPVCVLFSGVMVELGLYGATRVYWTIFAGPLEPHAASLRVVLIVFGTLTALLGALMCLLQHHLKRLLAFSTISHVGMFLIGIALLTPAGLAGAAYYALAHAAIKASLFLCTGILLHRFESVNADHLRGRGRALPYTGIVFALGGLGLAGLPPFGTFLGKGMIEDAAASADYSWATVVLILASIGTGGAVLRAAGTVFLGWGETASDTSAEESGDESESESGGPSGRTPAVMFLPAAGLLIAGLLLGLVPHLGDAVQVAAARFQNQPAYFHAVLGITAGSGPYAELEPTGPSRSMVVSGLIATAGALAVALLTLFWRRAPAWLRATGEGMTRAPIATLRALQSGHLGDYITWLTIGVAALGVACAATLR